MDEEKKTREDEPVPPTGGRAASKPPTGGAVPRTTAQLLLVETLCVLVAIVRDDSADAVDAQYAYDELAHLEPRLTRLLHSLRRGDQ